MKSSTGSKITTILFDVDDTLYDVGTGFTAHRNGDAIQRFMVGHFTNLETMEEAKKVRDEYFARYHSTAKGLKVAQEEGVVLPSHPPFDAQELSKYWATNLDFSLLFSNQTNTNLPQMLRQIVSSGYSIVAFSNGPRIYVKRVLQELKLWNEDDLFGEENLFAVDDVLPHCKPEPQAFQSVLDKLSSKKHQTTIHPSECILVEDSMKNIRVAKQLGMKTILVKGQDDSNSSTDEKKAAAEATKSGDAPLESDPAVDAVIPVCEDILTVLSSLTHPSSET